MRARTLCGALASALLIALSGCSSLQLNRPGRTAACAEALPLAFGAVHSNGSLVGFRVIHGPQLRMVYLALTPPAQRVHHFGPLRVPVTQTPNHKACLAVFKGSYGPGQVQGAPAGDHGSYAVLVIFVRHATIVRARLVNVLPVAVKRLL
jgi:hypothetical protein